MNTIKCLTVLSILIFSCSNESILNNVIVTPHPLATEIGKITFENGGNAFDAAVASAFALSVVEPSMSGIGGRLQVIFTKNDTISGIDATTVVPNSYVHDEYENGYKFIGVPGVVHGLIKLHENRGNIPLSLLLEPVIELANDGFKLTSGNATRLNYSRQHILNNSITNNYFLKDTDFVEGDTLIQKEFANVLKEIAQNGIDGFYDGWVAKKMVDDIQKNGGFITLGDLKNYTSLEANIISGTFNGYEINSLYIPSFGAITIQMLQLLDHWPLKINDDLDFLTSVYETSKYVYSYSRSAQFNNDTLKQIISYEKNKLLSENLFNDCCITEAQILNNNDGNTAHISVADKNGNTVSLTQTVGPLMGSGVITDSLGFVYATTMGSYLGVTEPGQRAFSHISPSIVTNSEGFPVAILGAAGGSRIPTSIVQTLYRYLKMDMNLNNSISSFRVHPEKDRVLIEQHDGLTVSFNPDSQPYKYELITSIARFGRVQAIVLDTLKHKWHGASDPDWEGSVYNSFQ